MIEIKQITTEEREAVNELIRAWLNAAPGRHANVSYNFDGSCSLSIVDQVRPATPEGYRPSSQFNATNVTETEAYALAAMFVISRMAAEQGALK